MATMADLDEFAFALPAESDPEAGD